MVYVHRRHCTYTICIVGMRDGTQTLIVHTGSLNVSRPSRRVSIPSERAVSVHTPSPRVAIESDRLHLCAYAYATYGMCTVIHAHSRFRTSQTISTACVCHFSTSVWVSRFNLLGVCRHTALIKTRGWGRSDAACRFRLFCSNRGQRVNPRPSVTVA